MAEDELAFPPHLQTLQDNMSAVERLAKIHEEIAEPTVGRKAGVEVLNKSAIVLLVACWESYVEELAETAFEILLDRAK